jgi:hypothetical protein
MELRDHVAGSRGLRKIRLRAIIGQKKETRKAGAQREIFTPKENPGES